MSELIVGDEVIEISSQYSESAHQYFTDIFYRLPLNTQRSYKSDLNSYSLFCQVNDLPSLTSNMITTEESIKAYVSSMCRSQLTHNTIVHRMTTLSKFMSIAKLPDPLKHSEYLRDFIKLEMREHDIYNRAKQAPALTLDILNSINDNVVPDTLLDIRDLALINVMFDGLLRADEVISIQLKHINFEKQSLLIPRSKTDQQGRGSIRHISNTSLAYISDYLHEANLSMKLQSEKDPTGINKGILFRSLSPKGTSLLPYDENTTRVKDMKKLNYTTLYRALKRIAQKAGITLEISAHSPRVGGAVSMAEANISMNKIQDAGGWKSAAMPARYTEQANIGSGMAELSEKFKR
jgi:integrase